MGIRELKAIYGRSLKSAAAVNAAIAAELPGGAALIEAMTQLHTYLRAHPDDRFARRALADLHKSRDELSQEIARKYDLASAREDGEQ